VQEFLLRVELPLGLRLPGGGFISQEVKPEDKMATDSQNDDIITLSNMTVFPTVMLSTANVSKK
jgi:hypothetical protein